MGHMRLDLGVICPRRALLKSWRIFSSVATEMNGVGLSFCITRDGLIADGGGLMRKE